MVFSSVGYACCERDCMALLEKLSVSFHDGTDSCFPQAVRMFLRKKKKRRMEISTPKNFEHRVHTSFDPVQGCFVGLPPQWQSIIETLKRPKPVVDPSRVTQVHLKPKKVKSSMFLQCQKKTRLHLMFMTIFAFVSELFCCLYLTYLQLINV